MSSSSARSRPDEVAHFEDSFTAIAAGADRLAFRDCGYHILMGASLRIPVTATYASWAEVVDALGKLDPAALPLDDLTRRCVADIHHAFLTFARVRAGEPIDYLGQVLAYLGFDDIQIPDYEITTLQESIIEMLQTLGFAGDLARGLHDWEHAREVETADIVGVCMPLVEASLKAAQLRGVPIPDHVAVDVTVSSTPYYAYAHYFGNYRGNVELTSDLLWTVEGLKHSICHEAFPGHQASASAREWAIDQGGWSGIRLPGLANSPTSPISEGLAENGARILGWIEHEHDHLFNLQNRLQFAVRTNAAIMRHQHGASRETAVTYMVREGGVSESWALYHEGFISDPLWHTSFPHYWHGTNLVKQALIQFQGREPELFVQLYGHPHTTGTLRDLLQADAATRDAAVTPMSVP